MRSSAILLKPTESVLRIQISDKTLNIASSVNCCFKKERFNIVFLKILHQIPIILRVDVAVNPHLVTKINGIEMRRTCMAKMLLPFTQSNAYSITAGCSSCIILYGLNFRLRSPMYVLAHDKV